MKYHTPKVMKRLCKRVVLFSLLLGYICYKIHETLEHSHKNILRHSFSDELTNSLAVKKFTETPKRSSLGNIHSRVQQQIWKLQNPPDCQKARKLLCLIRHMCGMGCTLHFIALCMMLSIGTNRTLQVDLPLNPKRLPEGIHPIFLPLSQNCWRINETEFEESVKFEGNGTHELTGIHRLVKIFATNPYRPTTDFAPLAFPSVFQGVKPLQKIGHIWWVGEVMTYITRLQPTVGKKFEQTKEERKFEHPIVGVHIRRTDKIREADYIEVDKYMEKVGEWYETHGDKNTKKRIFLATDEIDVYREVVANYSDDYEIISMINKTEKIHGVSGYKIENVVNIVRDIQFLSECDFLVCTFSSNVGRLAYEKMLTRGYSLDEAAVSLDRGWSYPGRLTKVKTVYFKGLDVQFDLD